jgi:hypothetical protein
MTVIKEIPVSKGFLPIDELNYAHLQLSVLYWAR